MIQEITTQESDGGFTLTAPSNHPATKQIKIFLICYHVAQRLADGKSHAFADQLHYWLRGFDMLVLSNLNKIIFNGNESTEHMETVTQAVIDLGELEHDYISQQ
jgi:hypothetical protein